MRGVAGRELGLRVASRGLAASVAALAIACSDVVDDRAPERVEASGPLSVYVVSHPLEYFTERIGGAHVDVVFPAPRDLDPAYWMPRRSHCIDLHTG